MGIAWYRDLSIVIIGLLCLIIMVGSVIGGFLLYAKVRKIIGKSRRIQSKIEDRLGEGSLELILGYATTIAVIGGYTYMAIRNHRQNKVRK